MVRPLLVWPNNQAFTTALDGESSPVDNADCKRSSRFTWSNSEQCQADSGETGEAPRKQQVAVGGAEALERST